jgi:hypothetical protein
MKRAEKSQENRFRDMPKFVKQHQQNMAAILVTAALTVLAEDFQFTPEQLSKFNEKYQKKAIEMT